MQIDGILRNWSFLENWGETGVYSGTIHEDAKGRFKDGESVTTSFITSGPDENGVIKTRNSVYRLEPYPMTNS